jgi:hypothetical protein
MEAMKQMKLETLKSRIGNADYEVDANAVAEAIVRRLLAARHELHGGAQKPDGPNGSALSTG